MSRLPSNTILAALRPQLTPKLSFPLLPVRPLPNLPRTLLQLPHSPQYGVENRSRATSRSFTSTPFTFAKISCDSDFAAERIQSSQSQAHVSDRASTWRNAFRRSTRKEGKRETDEAERARKHEVRPIRSLFLFLQALTLPNEPGV